MEPPKTSDRKPGRPFRSKIAPFEAEIAAWQREGLTYVEMAGRLKERGVPVHPDTINSFVLIRARGRGKRATLPATPTAVTVSESALSATGRGSLPTALPSPTAVLQNPSVASVARPAAPIAKRILNEEGKAMEGVQYAPANPDDL